MHEICREQIHFNCIFLLLLPFCLPISVKKVNILGLAVLEAEALLSELLQQSQAKQCSAAIITDMYIGIEKCDN